MKKEKLILLILATIQFTHVMDFMIIMPMGDILMKEFDIVPSQFSLIVSAYPFAAAISGLLSALFIDRLDRKHALLLSYGGFLIGTFFCAIAPGYVTLVVARALTGAFGGIMGALILAVIGDIIPNERRASAMGYVMAAFSAAAIAGVPFGLYLAEKFSWHVPFFVVAGLGLINVLLIIFVVPSIRVHLEKQAAGYKPAPLKDLANIFTNRNQLTGLLFLMMLILGHFTIVPFITPFLIRNMGFTQSQIPIVYLIGGALTLFTSPLVGKLSDKFGRTQVFTAMALLSIIPLLMLTHLDIWQFDEIYIPLCGTAMLFIFISGRMIPANTMLTSAVKPQQRGSYMSLNSSTRQLAAGLASLIAGLIIVETLNPATGKNDGPLQNYNFVGYIAVASSIIAIFLGRRLKVVDEDPEPAIEPEPEGEPPVVPEAPQAARRL